MDYKTLFTDDVNLDIGMGLIIPLSKVNKVLFGTNTDFHIIDKITLLNDNIIIEKNKKLKATKKPEEPVPLLDLIEQATYTNAEGHEVQGWVLLKNV